MGADLSGFLSRGTALVTGAENPTGLGAARALSQHGARVIGATRSLSAASCRSRAWNELVHVETGAAPDPDAGWLDALVRVAHRFDSRPFLLPTQDNMVALVSRHRDVLKPGFRFVLPDDAVVQTLLDKTRFFDWARAHDLPLPESRIVQDSSALQQALREMPYPLVLKPLLRTREWNRISPVNKVFRLDDPTQINAIEFDLFAVSAAYVVSQWIEGPDSTVHFCLAYCDEPGRMAASFTGRKLLQYPRLTGSTAIAVGTENDEVRELTAKLFHLCNFVGLGSLEVKYGPDGRPYITEPTVGRPNLQSHAAVASGCNLQAIAMAHALDIKWPPLGRKRRCVWVEERGMLELLVTRSHVPVEWRPLLNEAIRTHRFAGAFWAWRDPMPFLELAWGMLRRIMRRLLRR